MCIYIYCLYPIIIDLDVDVEVIGEEESGLLVLRPRLFSLCFYVIYIPCNVPST